MAIPLEGLMGENTRGEPEKRRVIDLLEPHDWGCDLLGPENWATVDLLRREPWQLLPNYNPKKRRIRRQIELVE
jgi:hypothetical protein